MTFPFWKFWVISFDTASEILNWKHGAPRAGKHGALWRRLALGTAGGDPIPGVHGVGLLSQDLSRSCLAGGMMRSANLWAGQWTREQSGNTQPTFFCCSVDCHSCSTWCGLPTHCLQDSCCAEQVGERVCKSCRTCQNDSKCCFWAMSSFVGASNIFYFHPYLGKWSNLTNNFSNGLKPPTSCSFSFPQASIGKGSITRGPIAVLCFFSRKLHSTDCQMWYVAGAGNLRSSEIPGTGKDVWPPDIHTIPIPLPCSIPLKNRNGTGLWEKGPTIGDPWKNLN